MATDIAAVLSNLTAFYDFCEKSVVHVGAGGGQLVGYAMKARHVVAVDPDADAVARLQMAVAALGLGERFAVRHSAFEVIADSGDVVLFEFCLHEIEDPGAALAHARTLAPETLVIDHTADSTWAWYAAETEKAARSWAAVERAGIRRERRYSAWQRFPDVEALVQKVEPVGQVAIDRAKAWRGPIPIEIPMSYRIAVL
jgi:precorrin-6B methylase 2